MKKYLPHYCMIYEMVSIILYKVLEVMVICLSI